MIATTFNMPPGSLTVASHNFPDRCDYVFYVLIAHGVEHWQADEPGIRVLGHRELAAFVSEMVAVVGMKVHRDVMHINADILRTQSSENFSTICRQTFQIETYGVQMPCRICLGTNRWRDHSRSRAESSGVTGGNFAPSSQVGIQL